MEVRFGALGSPRGSKYPIIRYLGFGVIGIIVQVLGKYMIIRYLDPQGQGIEGIESGWEVPIWSYLSCRSKTEH